MLILTRRQGERIRIGEDIIVTITKITPKEVRVGVDTPDGIKVLRDELYNSSLLVDAARGRS